MVATVGDVSAVTVIELLIKFELGDKLLLLLLVMLLLLLLLLMLLLREARLLARWEIRLFKSSRKSDFSGETC